MRHLEATLAVSIALVLGALPAAADDAAKAASSAPAETSKAEAKEAKKAADAKPIFLKYKCTMCHEIGSQKILKAGSTKADTTWMTTIGRAPDLSGVGYVRGEKWIRAWLRKTETINGRKHLLMFKGTDDELATLAKWLESLDDEKTGKALKTREETLK